MGRHGGAPRVGEKKVPDRVRLVRQRPRRYGRLPVLALGSLAGRRRRAGRTLAISPALHLAVGITAALFT